jgi:hypothetical protein
MNMEGGQNILQCITFLEAAIASIIIIIIIIIITATITMYFMGKITLHVAQTVNT